MHATQNPPTYPWQERGLPSSARYLPRMYPHVVPTCRLRQGAELVWRSPREGHVKKGRGGEALRRDSPRGWTARRALVAARWGAHRRGKPEPGRRKASRGVDEGGSGKGQEEGVATRRHREKGGRNGKRGKKNGGCPAQHTHTRTHARTHTHATTGPTPNPRVGTRAHVRRPRAVERSVSK